MTPCMWKEFEGKSVGSRGERRGKSLRGGRKNEEKKKKKKKKGRENYVGEERKWENLNEINK